MVENYTDNPQNIDDILEFVITSKEEIVSQVLVKSKKCFFYDACSFRKHAKLKSEDLNIFLDYVKDKRGVIVLTRVILMELASLKCEIETEHVDYIRRIKAQGVDVILMYEEDIFSIMNVCFSSNSKINEYLCWAVRNVKTPVSTITETLKRDIKLQEDVLKNTNVSKSNVYERFFAQVRGNKESGDNLGEELIAICLFILSYLPGEEDGKLCAITEDKGAIAKMDTLFRKRGSSTSYKKIGVFSTPKLVQLMQREGYLKNKDIIERFLKVGTDGNIVVLGNRMLDLRNSEISLSTEELAELITEPNGINIIF